MTDSFPVTESTTDAIRAFATMGAKNFTPEQSANKGAYLKFSGKTGRWEMGKDEEPFDGVIVFINIVKAEHGFVRWGAKPPAKAHTSILAPKPPMIEPFDGVDERGQPKTHVAQPSLIFQGSTFDEHKDAFVLELGSKGGVENMGALINSALARAINSDFIFPVVKLGSEFWTRETGKVYKPVFEVIAWCDTHGNEEGAAPKQLDAKVEEAAAEVPAPPAKKKRTKRTA